MGSWCAVADGDTLTVRFGDGAEETLRLLDVDTPETVHPNKPEECFGAQASDYTKGLMGAARQGRGGGAGQVRAAAVLCVGWGWTRTANCGMSAC